jgi:hypothetical protein
VSEIITITLSGTRANAAANEVVQALEDLRERAPELDFDWREDAGQAGVSPSHVETLLNVALRVSELEKHQRVLYGRIGSVERDLREADDE